VTLVSCAMLDFLCSQNASLFVCCSECCMYFLFLSTGIERKSKSLTEFKSLDMPYNHRSHLSQQSGSYQRGKCSVQA
jgi:hypothetical protein